jgi:hypothetical protein
LIGARDSTDSIHRGIDRAGEAIASGARALDFDAEGWESVAERRAQVDRIVSNLEVSVATAVGVASCNIRGPVSKSLAPVAPNASVSYSDPRIVDIEAVPCQKFIRLPQIVDLLRGSRAPIIGARDCQLRPASTTDFGWDQHGLVTW